MTVPFAGLVPDGRGELSAFDLQVAIEIGAELRTAAARGRSTQALIDQLLDTVNAFEQDGLPACVLVRAYVTRRAAGARPGPQLLASRGVEPAWNQLPQASACDAAFDADLTDGSVELQRQLLLDDPARPPTTAFHIAEAEEGPGNVARTLPRSYGVRSVFGFGARAWPGETVLVIAWSRTGLDVRLARALEPLALYTRVAWIGSNAGSALEPLQHARMQADALAELTAWHEASLRDLLAEHRAQVRTWRTEARSAAENAAADVERHNSDLRRTQRAILNVIEDLRTARESLESTVQTRTHELALANRKLELRNRELEEFVYIASHDLQEPLRTVSGYLQMIERRYGAKLGPDGDEFIRFAIEGAQRMQALIESLLVYARITTVTRGFERVSLNEPFKSAVSNLALRIEETQASIECSELPTIHADRVQMVQLFQNLLSNALKFSGPRPARVQVSASINDGMCKIQVRDWGIGFQPKFAERIFKVFRRLRRDTEGTGIGLAVCKKIAERHGGRITAESEPGQGATFRVELAVQPDPRVMQS